jgi:hypothetical protein
LLQSALSSLWAERSRKAEGRRRLEEAHREYYQERMQGVMAKLVAVGIYWA